MSWSSIVGQERVVALLRSALVKGRLAHAYLFSGPEGAGMDAVALALARVVNCTSGSGDACGTCAACRKSAMLQDPNISVITALPVAKAERSGDDPLAKLTDEDIKAIQRELRLKAADPYHTIAIPKANAIKINSIRQIRREASLSLYERGRRVFILIDAELMNAESANSLLKTLEEPHPDTLLLLTTSRPDQLLPTIVSRCQHVRFDPLSDHAIAEALRARARVPDREAILIARMARGNYARALSMIGTDFGGQREAAVDFLRTILYKPRQEMMAAIETLVQEMQRPQVEAFLTLLEDWFHDAQRMSEGMDLELEEKERTALGKFIAHHAGVPFDRVYAALARAVSLLGKNVYIPLILVNAALDLRRAILAPGSVRDAGAPSLRSPFEGSV